MEGQGGRSRPPWKRIKIRDPLPLLFLPLALLLLLFVVLPLVTTLLQTPLETLWQTATDPQVLAALGVPSRLGWRGSSTCPSSSRIPQQALLC
jgi:hypothetical protein